MPAAALSELEIRRDLLHPGFGLEGDELLAYRALYEHLDVTSGTLRQPDDAGAAGLVGDLLMALSNGLEEQVRLGDSQEPAQDRHASQGLGTLSIKIRAA